MNTYLLTWNPNRFDWHNHTAYPLSSSIKLVKQGRLFRAWTCGSKERGTTKVREGDRLFLYRAHKKPYGIVGLGKAASDIYEGADDRCVDIKFQFLLDPEQHDFVKYTVPQGHQNMCTEVKPRETKQFKVIERKLRVLWNYARKHGGYPKEYRQISRGKRGGHGKRIMPPTSHNGDQSQWEGGGRPVMLTRPERSRKNRAACIEHYKCKCNICGFDFKKIYGDLGADFIQVHHKKGLSRKRMVNPRKDMIPVCPNCHAVIHRRKPAFTVDEVKAAYRRAKKGH
jgi:5-methylcytosine-specific restriction protein A